MDRVGVKDDVIGRKLWQAERLGCSVCRLAVQGAWPVHAVHHLVGRSHRSDEPANYLLLCNTCHALHHGARIRVNGGLLPKITLGMLLRVKRLRDPLEFDLDRLQALYGFPLPAEEDCPRFVP